MIGMNQIKKRLINGILIGLAIGLVFVIITIIISSGIVKGYKEGTNKDFLANYTSEVVTFTRDVVQGERITADMLNTTRIHNNTVPSGAILSTGSLVGKVAKYNIVRNATAVSSMVSDKIISQDLRIQEVNAVLLPTDLMVNDFVDIRIMYPNGVEYIVLTQKQVTRISGTTIWMDMTDADTLILNSAIVDSYLTDGTKLYAVKYSDPTTQIKLGDTEEAMAQAKQYVADELGKELAKYENVTDMYTVPVVDIYSETKPTATESVVDLMTRFAIEYRYYVESYNKTEANYQPNAYVMAYMKTDNRLVQTANRELSEAIRAGIELNISAFETSNAEGYESVVSGINSSIEQQKSLRGEALGQ